MDEKLKKNSLKFGLSLVLESSSQRRRSIMGTKSQKVHTYNNGLIEIKIRITLFLRNKRIAPFDEQFFLVMNVAGWSEAKRSCFYNSLCLQVCRSALCLHIIDKPIFRKIISCLIECGFPLFNSYFFHIIMVLTDLPKIKQIGHFLTEKVFYNLSFQTSFIIKSWLLRYYIF